MPWGDRVLHNRTEHERREQGAILAAFERGEMRELMAPAKRISTHLSHVLLSDTRAFKLKRAVRRSFVDFSQIEQRRVACNAELAHNRHMACSLYDAVLPVTRCGDRRYSIDGSGEIVDWIVLMRRFDETQQFDRLAKTDALRPPLIERLAERVAIFHMSSPVVMDAGHVASYRELLANLTRAEASLETHARTNGSLTGRLKVKLSEVSTLIEARRVQGRVRRGHGDLHLGNVCMFDGVPTPFDALECDDRLATTDVLYDLAFLLMDLRRVGLAGCADAAVRRYWHITGEATDAEKLLPFFMATRAAVRMAVAIESGNWVAAAAYGTFGVRLLAPTADIVECDARAFG